MWQPEWEGSLGGERIHVICMAEPSVVHLKLSQHCSLAVLQYKIKGFFKKK